jgi:hypothetical protein
MSDDFTLIAIRERSFLDLLDLAVGVVRRRPGAIGLAAAAGAAPFVALNAVLLEDSEHADGLVIPLLLLEAPWATLPLTLVLGGLMFGRKPGVGTMIRRLLAALPALVFVHVLLRILLLVTILPVPLLPGRLWFASEVILLEKAGPLRAERRCGRLSSGRFADFFFQWLAQLGFGLAFAVCFAVGTGAVTSALFGREVTWEPPLGLGLSSWRFQVGVWIAIAFFAVARFLNYIDQRIRLEGWELRLRLQAAGRDLEETAS